MHTFVKMPNDSPYSYKTQDWAWCILGVEDRAHVLARHDGQVRFEAIRHRFLYISPSEDALPFLNNCDQAWQHFERRYPREIRVFQSADNPYHH